MGCLAINEIYNMDIKEYFSGKIIPGIELKMQYKNKNTQFAAIIFPLTHTAISVIIKGSKFSPKG